MQKSNSKMGVPFQLSFKLFSAFLVITLLANCKKEEANNCQCNQPTVDSTYLVFGKFYGMCFGEECVEIFKIENGKLYEDTTDHYPGDTFYAGVFVEQSSVKYNLVKNLPSKIPQQLLSENNSTIGIPDAYDQGGYCLGLIENGNHRFWRIDTDKSNLPAYLHSFTDTLRMYIDTISN